MLKDVYLKNSNIPLRYIKDTVLIPTKNDENTFNELKNIEENIKEFVKEGNNLLICSNNVGNGKTTWATKLLKAYINEVQNLSFKNDTPVLYINVNSFLNEKKLSISRPDLKNKVNLLEKNILESKLVVFDDIGDRDAELTDFEFNSLYYWIDYRTSNLKSCIFTSNQLPEQMEKDLNGKLYSRIVNYSIVKVITRKKDMRKSGKIDVDTITNN